MAATIKDVARTAGVSTATVSAVINESAYVSPALRARVLEAVRDLGYSPSQLARRLRTGASELIAIVVADLSNPFYARVVCAAEAAVAAWGFSLVVFNSDEKPEAEKRIISRVRTLSCEGLILVPVGGAVSALEPRRGQPAHPDRPVWAHARGRRARCGHDRQFRRELSGDELPDRPRSQTDRGDHRAAAPQHRPRPHRGYAGRHERQGTDA